ncbi:MAG: hypothetical protein AB4058_00570 [Microcystaceae cyanobacterium]
MANLPDTPKPEPTLIDVLERIDNLSTEVKQLSNSLKQLSTYVKRISTDMKQFEEQFSDYHQATQWMVRLAFTLIASATITVILTSVLK